MWAMPIVAWWSFMLTTRPARASDLFVGISGMISRTMAKTMEGEHGRTDWRAGPNAARLARHRRKLVAEGSKRVEVVVPAQDAGLIRAVAATLREDSAQAGRIRERLTPLVRGVTARSGRELVAFFRSSPLVGEDLVVDRDRSEGRSASF
jgi:hypothetical protein